MLFWNECNSVETAKSLEEGAGIVVLYTLAVLAGYSDRITQALEVFKIPLIEYGLAFLCAALIWLALLAAGKLSGKGT